MLRRSFIFAGIGLPTLTITNTLLAHPADVNKVKLSAEQWQEKLSEQQFDILRRGDTEPAGSSALNAETRPGTYLCAGCELPLFKSDWKYDSGTGWPSFWDVFSGHVNTREMHAIFRNTVEYHCAQCGGHQGHIFDDGPQPTGLRYCNNGLALTFEPA